MPVITYHIIQLHKRSRILVKFPYNQQWSERIKKVPGAQWSQTYKAWHIPDSAENRKQCGLADSLTVTMPIAAESIKTKTLNLSANNRQQFQLFTEQLILKKYRKHTLKTYGNQSLQLFSLPGDKAAQELAAAHLKRYMLYCGVDLKLSENTRNKKADW